MKYYRVLPKHQFFAYESRRDLVADYRYSHDFNPDRPLTDEKVMRLIDDLENTGVHETYSLSGNPITYMSDSKYQDHLKRQRHVKRHIYEWIKADPNDYVARSSEQ